jgi:cytochrome P450
LGANPELEGGDTATADLRTPAEVILSTVRELLRLESPVQYVARQLRVNIQIPAIVFARAMRSC